MKLKEMLFKQKFSYFIKFIYGMLHWSIVKFYTKGIFSTAFCSNLNYF